MNFLNFEFEQDKSVGKFKNIKTEINNISTCRKQIVQKGQFVTMLSCTIGGHVPDVPVVSIKSGHVFEKRLILKHLNHEEKCPVTLQDLTPNDLVEIKINKGPVAPRPPSATSISSLLRMFQEEVAWLGVFPCKDFFFFFEWDTLLLESYKMKKYVADVRQELSHALYQHDAACRVIARVTQERDKVRT